MAFYRLRRPKTDNETTYLEGLWPWRIPYLACDVCGKKLGFEGVSYPAFDLSQLPNSGDYLGENRYNAQPPRVIQDLLARVRALIGTHLWIPPRTNFGQFSGHVEEPTKRLYDFAWAFSLPFLTEAALRRIEQAGVRGVKGFPALIAYRKRFTPTSPYLELQVEHEVSLADPLQPRLPNHPRFHSRCDVCGYNNGVPRDPLRIRSDTIPIAAHIMRCREYPICKIVSEEFALAIMRLKLSGVCLEMVESV